jgi:RND family efflux transporter MFP subunit
MRRLTMDELGRREAAPFTLFILLLAAGCSSQSPPPSDAARPIQTLVVAAGEDAHARSFPGKAEASKKAALSFQVSGLLERLGEKDRPLREGDRVAKGELIARLRQKDFETRLQIAQDELRRARADLRRLQAGERPEQILRLEAQVRATEADMVNSRAEFDRNARLRPSGAVSKEEFERSESIYHQAREAHKAARLALEKGAVAREEYIEAQEAEVRGREGRVVEASIQLKDTELRAPYDGVIAQRFVEVGQAIKAKDPIVKFQDADEIEVVVDVPETAMATIRLADIVEILAEFSGAPGLKFPVEISEVAQRADPATQTFQVRVGMKKPPSGVNILPGMSATVTLTYRRASILGNRILVPISAVFKESTGEQVAWVIGTDQTVTRRPVKVGAVTGGQIEIVDGLQPGDRIATAGLRFLREGMKVRDLGDQLGGGQP